MTGYLVSPVAECHLESIWEFIAEDNPNAADLWIEKLFRTFQVLARSPKMGHTREDLTSASVLFWPVGAYLVIYRLQGNLIEIVAVTQGARDIPAFLRSGK